MCFQYGASIVKLAAFCTFKTFYFAATTMDFCFSNSEPNLCKVLLEAVQRIRTGKVMFHGMQFPFLYEGVGITVLQQFTKKVEFGDRRNEVEFKLMQFKFEQRS